MKVNLPKLNSTEVGRPRHRVRNPFVPGNTYVYRQPVYDYYGVTVATLVTRQVMFQIPQGQNYTPSGGAVLVKNLYHTNMNQAGVLEQPRQLLVKAIRLHIDNDVLVGDANRFLNDVLLQFNISGKEYALGHGVNFPAAGGVYGFSAAVLANGQPQAGNLFQPSGPEGQGELINSQQTFNVVLDPAQVIRSAGGAIAALTTATAAAGGSGINARVELDGLLTREVQ